MKMSNFHIVVSNFDKAVYILKGLNILIHNLLKKFFFFFGPHVLTLINPLFVSYIIVPVIIFIYNVQLFYFLEMIFER